jgi:endogenous inhibitor of DNA gyrase (YacG/DUF329 family)
MDIGYMKNHEIRKKCSICGKEFKTYYSFEKFCSAPCKLINQKNKSVDNNKKYAKKREAKFVKKFGSKAVGKVTLVCKTCGKEYQTYLSHIKHRGSSYCSLKCARKISSGFKAKKNTVDVLWAKLVKILAGNKCEYCGITTYLNSHHIFSRTNHSVRWDENNGVCLCAKHHVLGSFSAHKAPLEFAEWLKDKRGDTWYNELRIKAKITLTEKIDYMKIHEELKIKLEKLCPTDKM